VPPSACAPYYLESLYDPSAHCYLSPDTPGVCCPSPKKDAHGSPDLLAQPERPLGSTSHLEFDLYSLNHTAYFALQEIAWVTEFEGELSRRRVFAKKGSSSYSHSSFMMSKSIAREMAKDAMTCVVASQNMGLRFGLTADQAGFGLKDFSTEGTMLSCLKGPRCNAHHPYRSYDASCNNLENSLWGTSNSAFQRILLPSYSDGVFKPREAKCGLPLPSARLVSASIVQDGDAPNEIDTLSVMQWGQFVDHDITISPVPRLSPHGEGIQCCLEDGSAPVSKLLTHPSCFPIEIPENDPFYMKFEQKCMNFVRSMPAPNQECTFGYGEQMNQNTHFLDGSMIYGSNEEDANDLRSKIDGLMEVFEPEVKGCNGQHKSLLPQVEEEEEEETLCMIDECKQQAYNWRCFRAGDERVNHQTGLTTFHTIWVREHNRVAKALKYFQPSWNDERLYQEARRIVVAEHQHITYNEWLPIVLGVKRMAELDILPETSGYNYKYNPKVNPSIINSFATAAFRFGHTLLQGMFDLIDEVKKERKLAAQVPLSDMFENPELIYQPETVDRFIIGLSNQPRQQFDNLVTKEVTNRLFIPRNLSFGMDLVALNLQRGRDHGIPGYISFRELCGQKPVENFEDLKDLIPAKIVEGLKLIYKDVEDVELFVAGISETPVPGALLGPTFQCIIGQQFKRLQHGDRFFYDSVSSPGKFSAAQLVEIRKTSLARILCDNGDSINQLQPLVFRKPTTINPLVSCDSSTIPRVDLMPWKKQPSILTTILKQIRCLIYHVILHMGLPNFMNVHCIL